MALIVTPNALKQMKAMPKADQRRMFAALELIAGDITFRHSFVTELVGEPGVWRARKGDWRAIYTVASGDVVVRQVGNRKDLYR